MSQALQFLILTTAGWLNRQQEDAIEYLREENRVLREKIGSWSNCPNCSQLIFSREARPGVRVVGGRAMGRLFSLPFASLFLSLSPSIPTAGRAGERKENASPWLP